MNEWDWSAYLQVSVSNYPISGIQYENILGTVSGHAILKIVITFWLQIIIRQTFFSNCIFKFHFNAYMAAKLNNITRTILIANYYLTLLEILIVPMFIRIRAFFSKAISTERCKRHVCNNSENFWMPNLSRIGALFCQAIVLNSPPFKKLWHTVFLLLSFITTM